MARPALLIAAFAMTAGAFEETNIRDLRLFIGNAPPSEEHRHRYADVAYDASGGGAVDGGELGLGLRGGLAIVQSVGPLEGGAVLVHVGFSGSSQESDPYSNTVTVPNATVSYTGPLKTNIISFQFGVGFALPLGRRAHLELVPFVGVGRMSAREEVHIDWIENNNGAPRFMTQQYQNHSSDMYYEGGARIGLFFTGESGLQFGIECGAVASRAEIDASGPLIEGTNTTGSGASATESKFVVARMKDRYTINSFGPFLAVSVGLRF